MTRRIVDVLMPVAVDQVYSYRVPEGLVLAPGDVVTAQLGARATSGVVWAENDTPNPRFDNRLKDIEDKLDIPPLRPELRKFVDWVADYTLSSAAWCCACVCAAAASWPRARESRRAACGDAPKRMTAARARVLGLLADGMTREKAKQLMKPASLPVSSTG
jgi:primosomal protein N' (replication factor Y)